MFSQVMRIAGALVIVLSAFLFVSPAEPALATKLTVVGFNTESGNANPGILSDRYIAPIDGVDLWGFSEVQNDSWALEFESGTEVGEGANFIRILGTSGGGDRLAIVYDSNLLQLVDVQELDDINIRGRVRAPLVGHFRIRATGAEFLFMVNHLYRGSASGRQEQATLLKEWAQAQTLPIIAVGDYNFDWDIRSGQGNRSFEIFSSGGVYNWVRPRNLVPTICGFNSILDFTFVANEAQTWSATSEILFDEESYCPDNDEKSDHRPVLATLEIPDGAAIPTVSRDEVIERIDAIERELDEIKSLIRQMS